jgi:hypothetical protein
MEQPVASPYTITDFLEWHASRQLVLTPKFQRRDVWIPKAKSYLIDTIFRSMPIPPLFIRLIIDPVQKRSVREVVDGQQRLRTVLSYIRGDFSVLKVHNPEFAGMYYTDLPEDVQKNFLGYRFLVHVLQDVSDGDVLSIFARMNTYTVKLVAQELRNAQFFGAFKQTVYDLAHTHNAFWRNNNILSDSQISRMADAELVSELVMSMLDGIRQTKAKDLNAFYGRYDDEFPQAKRVTKRFSETVNIIGDMFGDTLRASPFRLTPLFYSLFCAVYDGKYGLPKSNRPPLKFTSNQKDLITEKLRKLGKAITSKEPPAKYDKFIDAAKLSTADPGKRKLRHSFIWDQVLMEAVEM